MTDVLARYAFRDTPNSFKTSPKAPKYRAYTAMLIPRLVTVFAFEIDELIRAVMILSPSRRTRMTPRWEATAMPIIRRGQVRLLMTCLGLKSKRHYRCRFQAPSSK